MSRSRLGGRGGSGAVVMAIQDYVCLAHRRGRCQTAVVGGQHGRGGVGCSMCLQRWLICRGLRFASVLAGSLSKEAQQRLLRWALGTGATGRHRRGRLHAGSEGERNRASPSEVSRPRSRACWSPLHARARVATRPALEKGQKETVPSRRIERRTSACDDESYKCDALPLCYKGRPTKGPELSQYIHRFSADKNKDPSLLLATCHSHHNSG